MNEAFDVSFIFLKRLVASLLSTLDLGLNYITEDQGGEDFFVLSFCDNLALESVLRVRVGYKAKRSKNIQGVAERARSNYVEESLSTEVQTISTEAAGIIAGGPSIGLLIEERKNKYEGIDGKEARANLMSRWDDDWRNRQNGRWTGREIIETKERGESCIEAYFNRYPERRQPNMSIFGRLKENLVEYGGFNKPRPKNYRIQDAEDVAINVVGMVVTLYNKETTTAPFQLILNADWISAIGTYNKLSKTNYFLKISFGQMKVTNVTNNRRQLDAFESLEIIKRNNSMNKDNCPIPTSPLFALINKDSYGSVNRGKKIWYK
ncbi:hypothetical protein NQ318_014925 [Aromia moschata]|uniref:Uncharacterized protein n=1 Tax=Aromia moschata TaxID=1265417 RepID=A0AAV8XL85_9CUCU|nr:hypothetical protein NQ318_014925 [Aromia moschata]